MLYYQPRRYVIVPTSITLHKCEAHIESEPIKYEGYIRQPSAQSLSGLSKLNYKGSVVFSAEGQASMSGSVQDRNLAVSAQVNGKSNFNMLFTFYIKVITTILYVLK